MATQFTAAAEFLYSGAAPVQIGVDAGSISPVRVAILRGRTQDRERHVLAGVTVTIKNHPELGSTSSRPDGQFDLVVNGGGRLTIDYKKPGYIAVQRQVDVPWQDFVLVGDVVMITRDPLVTQVSFGDTTASQVARGTPQSDQDGTRQATVLIPPGTTADLWTEDGGTRAASTLHLHLTEFTVGPTGPDAMPGPLPSTSGYTYAVELTADEVTSRVAGKDVIFNHPVSFYVENFLGFPTGAKVPVGSYDSDTSTWIPSPDGRIIKVLSVVNGLAELDTDGDGAADDGAAIGVTGSERAQLAGLYSAGATLERIPLAHFSVHDPNFSLVVAKQPSPPPQNPAATAPPDPDCDTVSSGSVIECERQALGERVPLVGTPFSLNYRSNRVAGRTTASTLEVPLTGSSVSPSLEAVTLAIHVGGRAFTYKFGPAPNLRQSFTWDGIDAYGRSLTGTWPAEVVIGYQYASVYAVARTVLASFGLSSGEALQVGDGSVPARFSPLQRQTYRTWVRAHDTLPLGTPGWSLDVHHAYDPMGKTLFLGSGAQRSTPAVSTGIVTTVVRLKNDSNYFHGLAVGQDGIVYYTRGSHLWRVTLGSAPTVIAGAGLLAFNGDGIPASSANLDSPKGLAVADDGSIYIADEGQCRVRRIDPAGLIWTVAGNGECGFSGDGALATSAKLGLPDSIALGNDGSVYIAEYHGRRVRRVGPDGLINTVSGNGVSAVGADGVPAVSSSLSGPRGVAMARDGSLYISDDWRIRRVDSSGLVTTAVGGCVNRMNCDPGDGRGDGLPATSALINGAGAGGNPFAFGKDGSFYIADSDYLRRVAPDGVISTIAGLYDGSFSGDGRTLEGTLMSAANIAFDPDDSLYIDTGNTIRRIVPQFPGFSSGDLSLASDDGRQLYQFDSAGRHQRTLDALTGATLYRFGYDGAARLSSVTDVNGDVTTLEYGPDEHLSAVVAPFGQRTTLSIDSNVQLVRITNPAGEAWAASYSPQGLMTSFAMPSGDLSTMSYDAQGRLLRDANAAGGSKAFTRTELSNNGYEVQLTTALGQTTSHRLEYPLIGGMTRTTTRADGTRSVAVYATDATSTASSSDGTVISRVVGGDPRFGMQAPFAEKTTLTSGGNTLTSTVKNTTTLRDPSDLLSLINLTTTLTSNGRTSTSSYDAASRSLTLSSPTGIKAVLTRDAQGHVISTQTGGLAVVTTTYDAHGRPVDETQGLGSDARNEHFSYDARGRLSALTDPLGGATTFEYDLAGRVTGQTRPDGSSLGLAYDANGSVVSITPPGSAAHAFSYAVGELLQAYQPPATSGTAPGATTYAFDADQQLSRVVRPDGHVVDLGRDQAGRLITLSSGSGVTTYGYSPDAGTLATVLAPGGVGLALTFAGFLPLSESWTGPVSGGVVRGYGGDFLLTSLAVNGAPVTFDYDDDLQLSRAGALTIARRSDNGLVSGTTLGKVTTTRSYNAFGELSAESAAVGAVTLYSATYVRDKLGRITGRSETISGTTSSVDYGFDLAGRLTAATVVGGEVTRYQYDPNGNRTAVIRPAPLARLDQTSDAQDRITGYAGISYAHTANGERSSKTAGTESTLYDYDEGGNLRGATLPDGSRLDYVFDGLGRQIGKKVNGVLSEGFLYEGRLRPVAWLDGAGALKARFVYGTRINVPDYIVTASASYRVITDHLGSPRLIVDSTTGVIAQRMDYDEWGVVLSDTNPGFQPFGFAGGLYDRDTGFVRFGARDYDASTGRWTSKDPLLFGGGDANVYAYVGTDPVNYLDPSGLCFSEAFKRIFNYDRNTTNDVFFSFPTSLVRTALGSLTAGSTAATFGTITPVQAIRAIFSPGLGPRGVATLGGVGGTVGNAVLGTVLNAALVSLALEAGITVGAAADALGQALADDSPCRGSCGAN